MCINARSQVYFFLYVCVVSTASTECLSTKRSCRSSNSKERKHKSEGRCGKRDPSIFRVLVHSYAHKQGTQRRKKKVVHKTATDDKKLQVCGKI